MNHAVSFEQSLERLEEIVARLSKGNVPLDEVISLYREGSELAKKCSEMLEQAELVLQQAFENQEGEIVLQDMNGGAE